MNLNETPITIKREIKKKETNLIKIENHLVQSICD